MNLCPVCRALAASEAITCQACAPFHVRCPHDIFLAVTVGLNCLLTRSFVASTPDFSKNTNKWAICRCN
jgi:hypothetical protein